MNIFLRQFRIPTSEVVEHLLKGESEKIGAEKLRGLLKTLPESDEVMLNGPNPFDVNTAFNYCVLHLQLYVSMGHQTRVTLIQLK